MRMWIEGTIEVHNGKAALDLDGNPDVYPGDKIMTVEDFVNDFLFAHGSLMDGEIVRITIESKQA